MVVDVAVSAQLQQWTFEKPSVAVRPDRSDSSASSPDLYNNDGETLRIDSAAVDDSAKLDSQDALSLQDRYLSSEEDLSPMEGNSDIESDYGDDVSIHDDSNKENCFSARKMSISRFENGKSCDRAVLVSYVSAGRPKMINLANQGSPVREIEMPQRSTSLVQLPAATIERLRKVEESSSRLSLAVGPIPSRSISPATSSIESRRPSTGHLPFSHNNSMLHISDSSSFTNASSRSSTPSIVEPPVRPVSAMPTLQPRASLYISSAAKSRATPNTAFPPLTPKSPEHSFLSSDPYENSTVNAASPIIKSAPHKRLRSISQKLSLAKIAITPSAKKWDSRVNGRPTMPPTPSTPFTPVTPQTAPPTGSFSSPKNRLRRNSRISRPTSVRGPSPELPPMAFQTEASPKKTIGRMVARGANEREPMLELPPFPPQETSDPAASIKSRRIRKRKSLMDLL